MLRSTKFLFFFPFLVGRKSVWNHLGDSISIISERTNRRRKVKQVFRSSAMLFSFTATEQLLLVWQRLQPMSHVFSEAAMLEDLITPDSVACDAQGRGELCWDVMQSDNMIEPRGISLEILGANVGILSGKQQRLHGLCGIR